MSEEEGRSWTHVRTVLIQSGDGSKLSFNREGSKHEFGRVSTLLLLILVQENRARSTGMACV